MLHTDNRTVAHGLVNGTTRGGPMQLLRRCLLLATENDLVLEASWISTKENTLADALSRLDYNRITDLAPQLIYPAANRQQLGSRIFSKQDSSPPLSTIFGTALRSQPDGNYDSPRARFVLFCTLANYQHQNGRCFPVKVTWLIEWWCSLAGTIKVKTMKLYLSGLKLYQLDPGIECLAFTDPTIERTIQGIKRDHNEPQHRIRTPLTRPYLLHILCHLPGPDYDNITLATAFTLAFAGFLRVGEFTYRETDRELGAFFSKWFLTKQHIHIPAGESYMELTIPASKRDPFRKGITLTIAASGDAACPVHGMRRLQAIDHHLPPSAPLFCIRRHQQLAFTREHVVRRLQQIAITTGLGQGTWNGHSFGRGAAP